MNSRIKSILGMPIIGILLLALIVRLIHYYFILDSVFLLIPEIFEYSDMHTSFNWAQSILNGDILGKNTFHPFKDWMFNFAPSIDTWHQWWGGKEIFHQAPLYAYLIAAQMKFLNLNTAVIVLGQLVIGVAQCWVIYEIGKSIFGKNVGLIGATIAAVYGPFVFFEGILLADSWFSLFNLLSLLLFIKARKSPGLCRYLSCGLLCGLALLTRDTFPFIFLVFAAITLFEKHLVLRQKLFNSSFLIAGFLIAISPLLIRNYLVGAPITARSTQANENIVMANAIDGHPLAINVPKDLGDILEKSKQNKLTIISETIKTYEGNYKKLFNRQLLKVRALFSPLEVSSNTNYNFGKHISPILRILPSFACIFSLALLGINFLFKKRPEDLWIVYLFLLALLPSIIFSEFRGEYRLAFVAIMILFTAQALLILWNYLDNKKYLNFVLGIVVVILGSVFQRSVINPYSNDLYNFLANRPTEYFYTAEIYDMSHDSKRAIEILDVAEIALKDRKDFPGIKASIQKSQTNLLNKMAEEK